jgi:RNA polymerase sigma factor (sigma-70 family)
MLMAAYQEGDTAAFEQLYSRYEQKIYNFLLRRLGDKELCHDLFQEIFLKLHRARHEFDPQHSFSTWLFTIVNNTLKNEFKRLTRITGSSEAAVKQKAHRGFMQLREILQGRIESPNPNPDKPEPLRAQPNGKKLLVSGFYESSGLKSNGLNADDPANPDAPNFKVTNSSILSTQQEVRL